MKKCAVLAWVALVGAWNCAAPARAQVNLDAMAQRAAVRYTDVPRQVLAFYYPWYYNPAVPGGAGLKMSWENLDEKAKTISNVTHFPAMGPYDSHDPKLIAQHCAWAKKAGIDGWIISWWGRGDPTDRVMSRILDACQEAGLRATIYYETVPQPQNAESAAKDLLYVLNRYAKHPAWLRVEDKPVLFIYGRTLGEIGLPRWLETITQVNREYPEKAVFIGDQLSTPAARIFDGIHTYNTAGMLPGKSLAEVRAWAKRAYPAWVKTADALGRISTLTVIPGYDDTKIRKPGLRVDRMDGASYRAQWEEAIAADPHWVLVTSWNEWFEGSEIEPSAEFGHKYLELTAQYTTQFKGKPRAARAKTKEAGPGPKTFSRDEVKKLESLRAAILPDPESSAIWALMKLPAKPPVLSWEQVADLQPADVQKYPVLFYLGGEGYRQTVRQPGDVDSGLLRWLGGGGTLVVLPSGPMPFHYDQQGATVESSRKFGLPLSVAGPDGGWEQPPQDAQLRFVRVGNHLPHVPAAIPFPIDSDPRWRPFVRSQAARGDLVAPILELRDQQGKHYGDGVAYVEHKTGEPTGGRVLYVWFGLVDGPQGDALLEDLLLFVAGKLAGR